MCVVPVYTDFLFYFILFLFFIINNGFVLKEKPGTLGVYMKNNTSNNSNTKITKIKHF